MDIYTTTFTYPRVSATPHLSAVSLAAHSDPYSLGGYNHGVSNALDSRLPGHQVDAETVQKLALKVSHLHGCIVTPSISTHSKGWNFHISGTYQQVVLARGSILRECPSQHRASIKLTRSEILDLPSSSPQVKPEVRARLDEVAEQTHTHIAVVNSPQSQSMSHAPPDRITADNAWSGLETERVCELTIAGTSASSVDVAKVCLLVMLDELGGLHAEASEIDQKLHAIVAGRRRAVIQSIQEETSTNIYFPSPLQGLFGPDGSSVPANSTNGSASPRQSSNTIWITGEFFGVQRARDMLYNLSLHQSKNTMTRDAAILPRKVDWMLTDRSDDLRAIMSDNATFISFPPIGSSTSLITVYGESKVNIQRTIRSVMQLACQFYVASLWLLPMQFNVLLPQSTLNPSQLSHVLKEISDLSGAEIVFKTMCFEMHGLEHEVRNAVAMVLELDAVKSFHHEIRFQIELANEHREFISGKKNGKINKIMQSTNVKIKFETFNDHNFLIDISGNDGSALHGLALLQEELPAEISFHVPEAYHKRIIGVGGKSIQRIMKKYGVYVKFSNAEEFATLGGYLDNEDNVVARTPAKNAINLDNLKQSVMELVNPKDKDFMVEKVAIPRKYHRTLLGEKSIFVHDIEVKTNCKFRFPDKEAASEIISIFGPESQVHIASTMLLDHVPFEAEMIIPPHADISRVCNSADFLAFADSIKRDFEVSIVPSVRKPLTDAASLSKGECSFRFMCQRSNSDYLVTARELLEQFLISQNVPVYPSSKTHKRADSFAESLPHFDSKLLSAPAHPDVSVEKRLRMANSSPDVKALFNNPQASYLYNIEQADEVSDNQSVYDSPSNDYWTPLPNIGGQTPVARARHADEPFKRGSDSLLESKIKEKLNKPRSMQNRAQSLDLTFSLSRITEASSYVPDSPTTSTADEGNSSPTSATAPSFPSVYAPPPGVSSASSPWANSNTGMGSLHSHGRSARIITDESAEEVARVISKLSMNDNWSQS